MGLLYKRSAIEKKIKEREKYLCSFKRKLDRENQEVNSSSFASYNQRYFVSFLFNYMEIIITRIVDNDRFHSNPEKFSLFNSVHRVPQYDWT